MKCIICGIEHDFKCSLIKAYEYYPDGGGVKRVEFVTFADMPPPVYVLANSSEPYVHPPHPTLQ